MTHTYKRFYGKFFDGQMRTYRTLASAQRAHDRATKKGYVDSGIVYDAISGLYVLMIVRDANKREGIIV